MKRIVLMFIVILVFATSISSEEWLEVEKSLIKTKKEWQKLKDKLDIKQKEYVLQKEKRELLESLSNQFQLLTLENKKDWKMVTQIELKELDREIWNKAWAKENIKKELEAKNQKMKQLTTQAKETRDFEDSLQIIGKEKPVNLEDLKKSDHPKTSKLIELFQSTRDSMEILNKLELQIPDSVDPVIWEWKGMGVLVMLKRMEEKRFAEKVKISLPLTEELQNDLKTKLLKVNEETNKVQKEIENIQEAMKKYY